MLISGHALGALLALDLFVFRQLCDDGHLVIWVTLGVAIAIDVGPVVLDDALAKEAFAMLDVDVALVAGTLLLAAVLAD